MSVMNVMCCYVEVSATDLSLVQRSPTDCGTSLCVIYKTSKEEAKTRYGAVENTTKRVVTPRKQTNKQMACIQDAILQKKKYSMPKSIL